ncbi:hypothetical protein Tco_0965426 [Tanacetum coccineum]
MYILNKRESGVVGQYDERISRRAGVSPREFGSWRLIGMDPEAINEAVGGQMDENTPALSELFKEPQIQI